MFLRMLLALTLQSSSNAIANDKQRTVLPAVLGANNVVVMIDPDAGMSTNDPVIVHPTDIGPISIGGQKGHPQGVAPREPQDTTPHLQVEVGQPEDLSAVYEAHVERPLERPPLWHYIPKNALHLPDVPAVGEFRKLIEEAEKQQKRKP